MISFTCPKCGKALTAPDVGAGRKGRCACGASFVIPYPEPSAALPPPLEIEYEPEPEADEKPEPEDEPDPNYRPRRRRKRGHTGRWVALVIMLLLVGAIGGWVATRGGGVRIALPNAPTAVPSAPPDSWTHQELLAHLNRRGARYAMSTTNLGSFFGPAAFFAPERYATLHRFEWEDSYKYDPESPVLYVQVRKTAQEARDEAGVKGERGFAWGRFLFEGSPPELIRMKDALR